MTALNGLHRTAELHRKRGLDAIESQMLPDAVAELREALRLDPAFVKAWNDLGVVMEALGNCSEALQCYGRALQLDPNHLESRTNLMALTIQLDLARAFRHQAELAHLMQ